MKKILLSAFSVFGDYVANSSELVAHELNQMTCAGFEVSTVIFPATIPDHDRGILLYEKAYTSNACGIISLGMGSDKRGLTIETCTMNGINNEKYCLPHQNGTPIDPNLPYGEIMRPDLTQWNVSNFRRACARDLTLPAVISEDAGGFCCNHLMYQLYRAQQSKPEFASIPSIFIHIPCSPESINMPVERFESQGKLTMRISSVVTGIELLLKNAPL